MDDRFKMSEAWEKRVTDQGKRLMIEALKWEPIVDDSVVAYRIRFGVNDPCEAERTFRQWKNARAFHEFARSIGLRVLAPETVEEGYD